MTGPDAGGPPLTPPPADAVTLAAVPDFGRIFALVIAVAIGLAGLLVAMVLSELVSQDRDARLGATVEAERQARVYGDHAQRGLMAVESVLAELAASMPRRQKARVPPVQIHRLLRSKALYLVQARELRVFDADGTLVADSVLYPLREERSVATEPFFVAHRDAWVRFYIDVPRRVGTRAAWTFALSRAIIDDSQRFVGVVQAVIDPTYFEAFYGDDGGSSGAGPAVDGVSLLETDGTILAAWPGGGGIIGRSVAELPAMARSGAEVFSGRGLQTLTTDDAIVSFYQLTDFPFRVAVFLRRERMMAGWRRERATGIVIMATIVIITGAFVTAALRQKRRQAAAEAGQRRRELAEAPGRDGIVITEADRAGQYPIVYVNRAFTALTGYQAADVWHRDPGLLHGADRDQPGLERLRAGLAEGAEALAVVRNYRKGGGLFLNEVSITPVRNAAGDITHFVGLLRDVTGRP